MWIAFYKGRVAFYSRVGVMCRYLSALAEGHVLAPFEGQPANL
jgi:hypothetical protein